MEVPKTKIKKTLSLAKAPSAPRKAINDLMNKRIAVLF
jgi:hypothetical protein